MENASKALIIAGAILLAILIISLGIFVFTQMSEFTRENTDLTELEIMQFNEKFTSFEGPNVRGSEVNSLLNRIVQNNVANQTDTSKQVEIVVTTNNWQGTKPTGKPIASTTKAQTGRTYNVKCDTDSKTGLVNKVTISDPSNS